MSEKRKREDGAPVHDYRPGNKKKQKTGFRVGPANLPDGTYKRKTQKIKDSLIQRAKIKKDYEKLKKHGEVQAKPERIPQPASMQVEEAPVVEEKIEQVEEVEEPTNEPHPDRQTLIEREAEDPAPVKAEVVSEPFAPPRRRERKSKPLPFKREHEKAQREKAEAEERRQAREASERERQSKIEERERFRRAMAKARSGGVSGQRKLGRESKVLLEKVQKMVNGRG
ncbi:hypothetical protein LTR97_005217 [Elasticomyces elasticus]|uniref:rRNA-processing protein FYV7 n=1 Tax=Elasticomyces elasticus TaxID=574655 RepID=A0AAN7W6S2_9PEZI|nr:hypothetical protein LTR97_005217 [Elasticomyces elasticus]